MKMTTLCMNLCIFCTYNDKHIICYYCSPLTFLICLLDGCSMFPLKKSLPMTDAMFSEITVSLTIFPQSAVYELSRRTEKRLEVKLWMVCSFHAKVLHFKVTVTVELLARADPVLTRCSVQYVSYTQS